MEDALNADVEMPQYELLPETIEVQRQLSSRSMRNSGIQDDGYDIRSQISESVPLLNYTDLKINPDDQLGKGGFGIVYEGRWNNQTIAVKQLYLNKFTRQEKISFVKEIKIMSTLGEYPNLVSLYGYYRNNHLYTHTYTHMPAAAASFQICFCELRNLRCI